MVELLIVNRKLLIVAGGHHQLGECSSSSLRDEGGAGRGPAPSEAQPLPLPPAHRLQVFRRDPSTPPATTVVNMEIFATHFG